MRRPIAGVLISVALVVGIGAGMLAAQLAGAGSKAGTIDARLSANGGSEPAATAANGSSPTAGSGGSLESPSPSPQPTPSPTPYLVPAPLDGLLVSPELAARHPIAVMVDDLGPARPQSGFSAASVVWQAPAEGGIPRYMMVFGENLPSSIGPVRSSRYYYITWAAEWRAVYVHVGGSPQALATLRAQGGGQLVYNADEFRFGDKYLWRTTTRAAPHNVYSDAAHLEQLSTLVGASSAAPDNPPAAVWQFVPDAPVDARPAGGRIDVVYPANHIHYDYDQATNTYLRTVSGEGPQHDAATGERVAPKNVVIMEMHFGPLNDGHPQKHRLEAQVVGSGPAWIATNGHTVKGTWRKASPTAPTLLFGPDGKPATLTAGQTFVQVIAYGYKFSIKDGVLPSASAGSASPSPAASGASISPSPSPS